MKRKQRSASLHRRLLVLILLLSTSCYMMRAQVAPTVKFNPASLEVTVGQLNPTKPTLSVTDPSTRKPIRGKFVERWGIEGVTSAKKEDNRVKFTDPTTGSKVSLLYGLDAIGNKEGKFTVVDTLMPQARYANDYQMVVAKYTVSVKSPTVTVEYYNGSTLLNGTPAATMQLITYGSGGYFDKSARAYTQVVLYP